MKIQFDVEGYSLGQIDYLSGNPFQVGDIVNLSVIDLKQAELDQYSKDKEWHDKVYAKQEELKKFDLTKIKLVDEWKQMQFHILENPEPVIVYSCEFCH